MNALTRQQYSFVLQCLCEGNSVASTTRITGTAKNTILSLLERAGVACAEFMDANHVNLPCQYIELDEIWSFVGHKGKGTTNGDKLQHDPQDGDVWTWKCVCADTKLIVSHHVGGRTSDNANAFCRNFAHRFTDIPQISTDGLSSYALAIGFAFGSQDVDYGKVVKHYKSIGKGFEICTGATRKRMFGEPDMSRVSTSFVERSNLTLRMQNRRFARRTNAHSKILDNHRYMLALGFMHYNYCRKHMTLKKTPAMAAGVSDHIWTIGEIVDVMQAREERIRAAEFEEAFAMLETA